MLCEHQDIFRFFPKTGRVDIEFSPVIPVSHAERKKTCFSPPASLHERSEYRLRSVDYEEIDIRHLPDFPSSYLSIDHTTGTLWTGE